MCIEYNFFLQNQTTCFPTCNHWSNGVMASQPVHGIGRCFCLGGLKKGSAYHVAIKRGGCAPSCTKRGRKITHSKLLANSLLKMYVGLLIPKIWFQNLGPKNLAGPPGPPIPMPLSTLLFTPTACSEHINTVEPLNNGHFGDTASVFSLS